MKKIISLFFAVSIFMLCVGCTVSEPELEDPVPNPPEIENLFISELTAAQDTPSTCDKFLYAIVNTDIVNTEDLESIYGFLSAHKDAAVIIVDASGFDSVQSLYNAIKEDALHRDGSTVGVQIFGTADMVPAFEISYAGYTQIWTGEFVVEEQEAILTDFFYSNFSNDPYILDLSYSIMRHFDEGLDVQFMPEWPVARLPLRPGQYRAFFEKYSSFVQQSELKTPDFVNFSNPIFPSHNSIDNFGVFMLRLDDEFGLINSDYRLYGNLKGDYPVEHPVLGDYETSNLQRENEAGCCEFIINCHGNLNNIYSTIFVGGNEEQPSFLSTENINEVLKAKPYYLDTWACFNGKSMKSNLTTKALNGMCVGMFSSTGIISNNGVNNRASLEEMKHCNFYYFYYNYFKALNEGESRAQAFSSAQKAYASSILEDASLPLNGERNVQFSLYNLLSYHNFGLIEVPPEALP